MHDTKQDFLQFLIDLASVCHASFQPNASEEAKCLHLFHEKSRKNERNHKKVSPVSSKPTIRSLTYTYFTLYHELIYR